MNTPKPFDLTGKIALVTGSTTGIGEGIARMLARAGTHVIISSRKAEDCERITVEFRKEGLSVEPRVCHIWKMKEIASIGYAVLYLCAPSRAVVSGASLVVDGGLTIATH